ncbi:hypothetical protein PRK78_004312 [Emydomyces testavorans]|uniref:Methyltransferase type 11 domain-containing protein n=1 Tax=Emydomyces testavorans TaxID=2070801 RepID=A0AAF0ILH7_9EURO|nr:hypothetical protein PRK78_004312 [Emydomyces testavorans]
MSSRKFSRAGTDSPVEIKSSASTSRPSRIPTVSNVSSATSKTQIPKATRLIPKSRGAFSASENENAGQRDASRTLGPGMPASKGTSRSIGLPGSLAPGVSSLPRTIPLSSRSRTQMQSQQSSFSLGSSRTESPRGLPPRNVLRRKAPSIEQYAERAKPLSPPSEHDLDIRKASIDEPLKDLTTPLILPPATPVDMSQTTTPTVPPELLGLSTSIDTRNLPPTPNFTSSPSTRYSDSPGPWSSRTSTSTPTSLSSYSPGLTHPAKSGRQLRQPSPSLFRYYPPRYHVSDASYPGATKDAQVFPKAPQRAQTEPAQAARSRLPTISRPQLESPMKTEPLPRTPPPQASLSETKIQGQKVPIQEDVELSRRENKKSEPLDKRLQRLERIDTSRFLKPAAPAKRPSRPSRTGTEPLKLESSPIIHSNLSASRLPGHKRHGSAESGYRYKTMGNPTPYGHGSTDSIPAKAPTPIPNPSSSPSKLDSLHPAPIDPAASRSLSRSKSVLVKGHKESKDLKGEAKESGSKRFGLFSKKPKTSSDSSDKQNRRGPVAGTGHEGYGRYAQRGRRPSVGSTASRARSTSTNRSVGNISRANSDMDDFLLDRLEPVVITGGAAGASLTRTYSEQSVSGLSVASTASSKASAVATRFYGQSSESLISSTRHFVHSPEPMSATPTTSLPKQNDDHVSRLTIVKRRSFCKPSLFGERTSNQSLSINTNVPRLAPPVDSSNTCRTSTSQSDVSILARDDDEMKDNKEIKKKKSQKPGRWNFFQRTHQLRRKQHFTETDLSSITKLPLSVSKVPTSRTVAHYALLESGQIEAESLEDILNHIEESPPTESPPTEEETQIPSVGVDLNRQQSVLLPAPPANLTGYRPEKRPSSPRVFFNKETASAVPEANPKPSRPTRLKSVGRIPAVVPRQSEQRKLPPQSFSRPFSRADMPPIAAKSEINLSTTYEHPSRDMSLPSSQDGIPNRVTSEALEGLDLYSLPGLISPNFLVANQPPDSEFLVLSPRKDSEVSESTSTESRKSLKSMTAVQPLPGSNLTEDEIWDEYDDFIDKVLTPPETEEKLSPLQNSFQMATRASRVLQAGLNTTTDDLRLSCQSECSAVTTSISSLATPSIHLSRSMIISALQPSSIASSTPASVNESCSGSAERNQSNVDLVALNRMSPVQASRSPQGLRDNESQTKEPDRQKNAALLDLAERERLGALAQANLRSGSLMTSRWLSFGRVLFSPAQNHVRTQDQSRILVIDGLGNEDWSFYCALTYPAATVYNLSSFPAVTTSNNPAAWDPPSNHRSVHHVNFENPFPFPKGFFNVAILRFPAACSETELKNAVSECKRVLRTGGYLEMSILDLDMVNMGSRTRKAVRILKKRIFTTNPSISLKPPSDFIQKLLGKHGFQNLNQCMVVVPVAGTIMKSSDTSSSGRSTGPTNATTPNDSQPPYSASTVCRTQSHKRAPSEDVNVSLGDLLSDPSPSASNDEYIAKMVTKVGRWWYTRCYETPVLAEGNLDGSIWADRRVLRECQRRGTGFKLLIAYAQKTSEVKRRTVSV